MDVQAACRTWLWRFSLTAAFFVLTGLLAYGQDADQIPSVGQINFFGYGGVNLQLVEATFPIKIGDVLKAKTLKSTHDLVDEGVKSVIGHGLTDIDFVCCDDNRKLLIYVGLGGSSSQTPFLKPTPNGPDHLSPPALKLYQQEFDALMPAVQRGSSREDDSKGYALASDPHLLRIQLAMRAYALNRGPSLERVLRNAADPRQRRCSAALLGYAKRSSAQVQTLIDAILDPDPEVRNNSTRALMVLASAKGAAPLKISLTTVEVLLRSGVWSDRNKASLLLDQLTAPRDPAMLEELRATVLDVLIEGARWHGDPGHAGAFVILLGRIAHVPENQLFPTPGAVVIEEIIKQARNAS
jgi:hypothetical protein